MSDYITEIVLLPEAKSVNIEIAKSPIIKELDIDILEIQREDGKLLLPGSKTVLKANDILKVRCNIEKLKLLQAREGIAIKSERKFADVDLSLKEARLVEAVVTPNSILIGRTLKGINFRNTFGATVLAIRHRGKVMREKLGKTILVSGDVLLVEVKKEWLPQLKQNSSLLIISEVSLTKTRLSKTIIAAAVILGVIISAAVNIVPIVISAIIGCVILILTDCITLEEAYKAIDWKVIFLLSGLITLGIALENSGGAKLISEFLISSIGKFGGYALVSAFFLLSMLLTAFMSNNATVVILIPIAVFTAESIGVNARPFLFAITIAASIDFMTPIGYQTNTMIYGPGNYKFLDYVKIGAPLNLIYWILASLLIPYFFPL
jgi:di/tricarboxylate transporter